jgi:hypothetical protein
MLGKEISVKLHSLNDFVVKKNGAQMSRRLHGGNGGNSILGSLVSILRHCRIALIVKDQSQHLCTRLIHFPKQWPLRVVENEQRGNRCEAPRPECFKKK